MRLEGGLGNQLSAIAGALAYRDGFAPHYNVALEALASNPHSQGLDQDAHGLWPRLAHVVVAAFPPLRTFNTVWAHTMQGAIFGRKLHVPTSTTLYFKGPMSHHYLESDALARHLNLYAALPELKRSDVALTGLESLENAYFVHVRRGDVHSNIFYRTGLDVDLHLHYYRRALQLFPSDATALICTNDVAWCNTHMRRLYPFVRFATVSATATPLETLRIMAACGRGGIMANSSFSWWGAVFGHHANSSRTFVGPSVFTRASWPLKASFDAGVLPPWCVRVAVDDGSDKQSWEFVSGALFLATLLALALLLTGRARKKA